MKKIVVILYGPPGSGKGTQANLLADKYGLIHFDTGRFLESVVHDPKRQKEAIVKRERALYDSGVLMTPSFVLREVAKKTREIRKAGWGLIFSGSPRTMHEAENLFPELEKLYGKKNIFIFQLRVPPEESMERNSHRMKCPVCGYGLLTAYYPTPHAKHCPVCGSSLYRRTDDKPKIIKIRLGQYKERTEPIVEYVRARGYEVHSLDARPAPYKVLQTISKEIGSEK